MIGFKFNSCCAAYLKNKGKNVKIRKSGKFNAIKLLVFIGMLKIIHL